MPIAIKCGMTPYDFWNGEPSLLYAYLESYQDKINEEAWLFGLYTNIAISNALCNAFASKGSSAKPYLGKPIDFKEQEKISKMTKEDKNNIAQNHFNKQARIKDFINKNKK